MHTRGRPLAVRRPQGSIGTTHAHAGQTMAYLSVTTPVRNHPCTRGADDGVSLGDNSGSEPPMHTRGRRILISGSLIGVGTTHAHAGQTIHHRLRQYTARNHPCTRGADQHDFLTVDQLAEPPMHTRGRRLLTRYNVRMSAKLYSVACIMQWMGR